MKYGYCTNHSTRFAVNAKKLCTECTRERHRKSAESKGFTIKEKSNGSLEDIHTRQEDPAQPNGQDISFPRREGIQKGAFTFKKAKIKPVSKDKAIEVSILAKIKSEKIRELGKVCEMCPRHGDVDLFHIIGVGDKKHSINPINLLLSCRFCHLVWGANDWGKIIKFKNFDDIMERLKSLDEGKYWKLKHKIDEYLVKAEK